MEFMQYFHKQKVNQFSSVFDHLKKQVTRHTYGTQRTKFLDLLKKVITLTTGMAPYKED